MLEILYILLYNSLVVIAMCNSDMQLIFSIIKEVLRVVHFFVPIVLILLCTVDIFKMVVSKKEDEVKKLRKDVFGKILYAVLIYLIPFLVPFILGAVDKILPMDYDSSWYECWNSVKKIEEK